MERRDLACRGAEGSRAPGSRVGSLSVLRCPETVILHLELECGSSSLDVCRRVQHGKAPPEFDTEGAASEKSLGGQTQPSAWPAQLVSLQKGFNRFPLSLFCLLPEVLLPAFADEVSLWLPWQRAIPSMS